MTTEPFVAPSIYKSADLKIVKIYVRRIITFEAPPPPKKRRRRKETSADSPDTIKDQYCSKTAVCYVFIVTVKIYYMILDFLFGARTIMTSH